MIIHLIAVLIKKTYYKMSQYFPKPYKPCGGDTNVKVHLSNYATKTDIKNITHVDTSGFALKTNLASLKTEVDKLDIDKLKNLPNNLSNLKTKADKLDIDKLVLVTAYLSGYAKRICLRLNLYFQHIKKLLQSKTVTYI